jgi:hypothetical protein
MCPIDTRTFQNTKAIIETLDFKRISRNDKGEFWEIFDSYLALGSKITEPSIVPNKFEFLGWYRFFDEKEVGPNTKFRSFLQQAVSSNDEAKMRLVEMALSDILVCSYEESAESIGAVPHRLFILSSSPSLFSSIIDLLARQPETWPPFEANLKRNLQSMQSVSFCLANKESLRAIYRLDETSGKS